ncbi:discoidin domain-containing protein [Nocardia sp. NBC_01009]|uniref:discoidin domain-containing protein n=1 Tax=Nocardia sp. NBC_01009 TaxID=2975996 RepID=UPI003862ED57|nr:discoidin domain-containing protein [Nocardia sp. NBC_01009]
MPDEDSGDVFLRHRGALLEAVLSDPSFGYVGSAVGGQAGPGESAPASTEFESELSAPVERRRPSDGPKASERILALLNGESQGPASSADYAPDYAAMAAPLRAPDDEDPPQPPQENRSNSSASSRLAPAQGVMRDILTQLRKPKVALAVGAVLAVLLVLMLVTTGGGEDQPQDRAFVVTPSQTAAPTTTAPPAAASSVIQVKSAQSKCPPGSTPAMDAFGGQPGKAWSCVRAYKVDGQIITIDLGKLYQIDSIGIVPGWDHIGTDGTDQWAKYRTVSRVSYQFNDGTTSVYTQPTLDQRTMVVTKLDPPVSASKIVLTVLESKGSPAINVTAISSVVITGR